MSNTTPMPIAAALAIIDHEIREAAEHLATFLHLLIVREYQRAYKALVASARMTPAQFKEVASDSTQPCPWDANRVEELDAALSALKDGLQHEGNTRVAGHEPHLTEHLFTRIGIVLVAIGQITDTGVGDDEAPVPLVKGSNALRNVMAAVLNSGMVEEPAWTDVAPAMVELDMPGKDLRKAVGAASGRVSVITDAVRAYREQGAFLTSCEANSVYGLSVCVRHQYQAILALWPTFMSGHVLEGERMEDLEEARSVVMGPWDRG